MAEVQADAPLFARCAGRLQKKEYTTAPSKSATSFTSPFSGPERQCARHRRSHVLRVHLEGHPEAGRIRFEAHYLDEAAPACGLNPVLRSLRQTAGGLCLRHLGGGKLMQEAT
jgi:hypothetical protein